VVKHPICGLQNLETSMEKVNEQNMLDLKRNKSADLHIQCKYIDLKGEILFAPDTISFRPPILELF